MDLTQLIEELSHPEAYPDPVDGVEVVHTHISVVFLAGEHVYKIKKPVELGFLDFRTLELREHFCREEVRLNRRGAPEVYVGVVPVVRRDGRVRVGGEGEVLEYAVHMKRLPDDRTLAALLARSELDGPAVEKLARRIADFHSRSEAGEHLAQWGGWEPVARNARENFEQVEPFIGQSVSRAVFDELVRLTEAELTAQQDLIERRAQRGVTTDTHGDLHLSHVYSFPEQEPPGDFLLVDCIEFNARFRYADPVADLAFLAMDLTFHGHPELSRTLADAYFEAAGDTEGRALMAYYMAYRAVVRGKVESFALAATEIPEPDRHRALERARPYFLLARQILAPAGPA